MKETEINSIIKLEKWLKENGYSFNSYSINGNAIHEGFGLENKESEYQWYYTERGQKQILKNFTTEKEAVEYALKKIKQDDHAKRNFIGMYASQEEVEKILLELKKREIDYWTDQIPYDGKNHWRTRIFVVGPGIKKAQDLIKKEDENQSMKLS